jgi:hypothetical protein
MSEIRLRNDTGESLDDVRVTPAGGDPVSLGPLPPGESSDWKPFDRVPRYPSIDASGAGRHLVHRPIESGQELPEGRYTLALRIESDRLVVDVHAES